jgi:hypothetical protein
MHSIALYMDGEGASTVDVGPEVELDHVVVLRHARRHKRPGQQLANARLIRLDVIETTSSPAHVMAMLASLRAAAAAAGLLAPAGRSCRRRWGSNGPRRG